MLDRLVSILYRLDFCWNWWWSVSKRIRLKLFEQKNSTEISWATEFNWNYSSNRIQLKLFQQKNSNEIFQELFRESISLFFKWHFECGVTSWHWLELTWKSLSPPSTPLSSTSSASTSSLPPAHFHSPWTWTSPFSHWLGWSVGATVDSSVHTAGAESTGAPPPPSTGHKEAERLNQLEPLRPNTPISGLRPKYRNMVVGQLFAPIRWLRVFDTWQLAKSVHSSSTITQSAPSTHHHHCLKS